MTPEQLIFNHKESRLQLVKDKMIQDYSLDYFYVGDFGDIFLNESITLIAPCEFIKYKVSEPK